MTLFTQNLKVVLFCVLSITLIFQNEAVIAQSSEQVWLEYMLNIPIKTKYNIEFASTYATEIETPKWHSLDFQITPEVALNKHVDFMAAILGSHTYQAKSVTTKEIREMIGVRLHIAPDKRVKTRLLTRLEHRNLYSDESEIWETNMRLRIRAETITPLVLDKVYTSNNQCYMIADLEQFISLNHEVHERFANRLRARLGIGYLIHYGLRLELVYTLQLSKNNFEDGYNSTENIFRFRLKQYLNKNKPSKAQGTGN
ncbi:MAG: DUF2490 domain-containing protein [Bacteroidia bacterium]|nr:DUF2490 domain-containing protein [Bacteroidia bacterium]HQU99670.1 DUF2490 domain-containing protein [Bacteroidia bacterium]